MGLVRYYPYLGCPSATQICGSHPIWGAHRTSIVAITPLGVPRYDVFRHSFSVDHTPVSERFSVG